MDRKKINLISDEDLSCSMNFENGYDQRKKIAYDLKRKFPNAKIFIVTRNKRDWLRSIHSEYIKNGGFRKYEYWYDNIFDKRLLDFDEYISLLESLFDEIMVLKYEELKANQELFVKKICDFIGVQVPDYKNKRLGLRLTKRQMALFRFMNVLFRNKYDKNPAFFPAFLNPLNIYRRVDKLSKKKYE